jgi:hypothetical protein
MLITPGSKSLEILLPNGSKQMERTGLTRVFGYYQSTRGNLAETSVLSFTVGAGKCVFLQSLFLNIGFLALAADAAYVTLQVKLSPNGAGEQTLYFMGGAATPYKNTRTPTILQNLSFVAGDVVVIYATVSGEAGAYCVLTATYFGCEFNAVV